MKMSLVDNLPYQFPRWPSALSRPGSSFLSKDYQTNTTALTVDNRNQSQRPDSASSSTKRIFRYHVCIPTGSDPSSPLPPSQPNTSFELDIKPDRSSARPPTSHRRRRSIPVRLKSTSLSMTVSKNKEQLTSQNFPTETHEQRKVTRERKRRKQVAQVLADKYVETDTWFQLKRSLSELKRLAISQEMPIELPTTFLHYDTNALKQIAKSVVSMNEVNRTSRAKPHSLFSRPQTIKSQPRLVYEPIMVAAKPIHPIFLTNHHIPPAKLRSKPPASPNYRSRPNTPPLSEENRAQLLLSNLSNENNPPNSISPSPPMVKIEREFPLRKASTPSQLTSTIKLKPQIPRCRSATDLKPPSILKHPLRFILICDQEHRIESWYHQYPFIHSDDLLISFQSKYPQEKPTISAYFIDDHQSSQTMLHGKSFHINNDWKKYDIIFISNSIYNEIMIYLQPIINLLKSSGQMIRIYQLNHDEDLKKQVKNLCKQPNL